MQHKPYMNNTLTWQAHTVMIVELDCVSKGKFPNGKKLSENDFKDAHEQVGECQRILADHGILSEQLRLF